MASRSLSWKIVEDGAAESMNGGAPGRSVGFLMTMASSSVDADAVGEGLAPGAEEVTSEGSVMTEEATVTEAGVEWRGEWRSLGGIAREEATAAVMTDGGGGEREK